MEIAAEDLVLTAQFKFQDEEAAYWSLVNEIGVIENRVGLYLTDANIDAEDAAVPRDHPEFWIRCTACAKNAAGWRAEEAGLDINDLIGRVIY